VICERQLLMCVILSHHFCVHMSNMQQCGTYLWHVRWCIFTAACFIVKQEVFFNGYITPCGKIGIHKNMTGKAYCLTLVYCICHVFVYYVIALIWHDLPVT